MKQLIFTLILGTLPALTFAISPQQAANANMQMLQDLKVENQLIGSSEFNSCAQKNKVDLKADPTLKPQQIADLENCFKKAVDGKDEKQLKTLADQMGLQSYGLIEDNNSKTIRAFLATKVREALTGEDGKKKKSFSEKRLVDQKVYNEIWGNSLAKNALHEISRFCFENFRKDGVDVGTMTFVEYWDDFFSSGVMPPVTDTGAGEFSKDLNFADKDQAYDSMFKKIGDIDKVPTDKFGVLFQECAKQINVLCKDFTDNKAKTSAVNTDANATVTTTTKGANACIARSRLESIRKAIVDNNKIKEFNENNLEGGGLGKTVQMYDSGKNGAPTIDDITSTTSSDYLLAGGSKVNESQLAADCAANPADPKCDQFIAEGETRQNVAQDIDNKMRALKEIQLERLSKIKASDKQKMKEYLESSGYTDLLAKFEEGNLSDDDIKAEVAKKIDAERVAKIEAIHSRMKSRQATTAEIAAGDKTEMIKQNASDSASERARMAQVVLFNNVITSYISLEEVDKVGNKKSLGRNVTAWKNEQTKLEANNVNEQYFQNLKDSTAKDAGKGAGEKQLNDLQALDTYLGMDGNQKAGQGQPSN